MSNTPDLADYITSYAGLISLAVVSIYCGSLASIPESKKKTETSDEEGTDGEEEEEHVEEIRLEDAYWFPVLGSIVLLSLYLIIKYISVYWINTFLQIYLSLATAASTWKMVTVAQGLDAPIKILWPKSKFFTDEYG
ncbi:1387_t:CDS:2, partial [Acaulospora colombiana]